MFFYDGAECAQNFHTACSRLLQGIEDFNLTVSPAYTRIYIQRSKGTIPQKRQVGETPFYEKLKEYFVANEMSTWLGRLLAPPYYRTEWYVIDVDRNVSHIGARDTWPYVTNGKEEALAWLLGELSRLRLIPDQVTTDAGGSITFTHEIGTLATIKKISFSPVSEDATRRSTKALQGLSINCSNTEYGNRLKKIDGLSHPIIDPRRKQLHYDHVPVHVTAKHLSGLMKQFLMDVTKQKIANHIAQELLATFLGFKNWNLLRGREKQQTDCIDVPYVLYEYDDSSSEGEYSYEAKAYYQGLPKALASFGKQIKHRQRNFYSHRPEHWRFVMSNSTTSSATTPEPTGTTADYINSRRPLENDVVTIARVEPVMLIEGYDALIQTLEEFPNLTDAFAAFLFAEKAPDARIVETLKLEEYPECTHLALKDWVFWEDSDSFSVEFIVNTMPGAPPKRLSFNTPETRLVSDEDNQFWIGTNGDSHLLKGLDASDAERISQQFNIDILQPQQDEYEMEF